MKNFIIFLSTFTITILLGFFTSAFAAGETPTYNITGSVTVSGASPQAVCVAYIAAMVAYNNDNGITWVTHKNPQAVDMSCTYDFAATANSFKRGSKPIFLTAYEGGGGDFNGGGAGGSWEPDIPPDPDGNCVPCDQLALINRKLNALNNNDIIINNVVNDNSKIINQTIYDMSQRINNIDNSIGDLHINQQITNNHLTMIDNSIGDLITNIENNNITQNEIKNEITNIYETINNYSLKLGDIELAMGDIDLSLKNTNKLVLDLGLDLDFIKERLVNGVGGGDSKDYTPYLNRIIELLEPCEPTEDEPCEPTDAEQTQIDLLDVLVSLDNFIKEDFEPSDENTEVPVTDLTDINLDRNLINFGVAQCPPDNEFSTMVNGFAFSGGFKHKPLCDFFTMLAPFVKAFGGFSAALILGGGLRR